MSSTEHYDSSGSEEVELSRVGDSHWWVLEAWIAAPDSVYADVEQ